MQEPFNGTSCLGVACVRSQPGGACEALPSCLNGLASWINRLELGSRDPSRLGFEEQPLVLPLSRQGPKGGAALAGSPTGDAAGHGGDGSCPELVPRTDSKPPVLQRSVELSGFDWTGQFQGSWQYQSRQSSPNGRYTERRQPAFQVQGKSTWWSDSSSFFLFWCQKPLKRWMLAEGPQFQQNKAGRCAAIAKAPSDRQLPRRDFWGWLRLGRSGEWVEQPRAGVASAGERPVPRRPGEDGLRGVAPQAQEPQAGEPGLAVVYACASLGSGGAE